MKPVAIFRHSPTEGPGYFATYLEEHRIPWRLIAVDAGDMVPTTTDGYAGLAFMGGPMSVNDQLPWVEAECRLIRQAITADLPVIGHCLGGQLMSKALGGEVTRNRVKEIGWGSVDVDAGEVSLRWLGGLAAGSAHAVFQWHGETFSVPAPAVRLMHNDWCDNQAFAVGPHLAMQFHVEMTPGLIASWCGAWYDEVRTLSSRARCIQDPDAMLAGIATQLPAMRILARQLYGVWCGGLSRT